MIPAGGKLLTAEQSVRLALMASVPRERLIEMLAAGLRAHAIRMAHAKDGVAPYSFYSRPLIG